MKKAIAVIFVVVFALAFTGCGKLPDYEVEYSRYNKYNMYETVLVSFELPYTCKDISVEYTVIWRVNGHKEELDWPARCSYEFVDGRILRKQIVYVTIVQDKVIDSGKLTIYLTNLNDNTEEFTYKIKSKL